MFFLFVSVAMYVDVALNECFSLFVWMYVLLCMWMCVCTGYLTKN